MKEKEEKEIEGGVERESFTFQMREIDEEVRQDGGV